MIDFACKTFQLSEIVKCALGLSRSDIKLMNFFMDNRDIWYTTEQLSNEHDLNLTTIQRSVKRLHEKSVIKRRQENLDGGGYIFLYTIVERDHFRELIWNIVKGWSERVHEELKKW